MLKEKKIQRRNLLIRFLYDFGNSFFFLAIGAMFLAQWLIIDNQLPDIRYGASFSLATLLALVTSPILGARSDKLGLRMPFLKWSTIGLIVVNGLVARAALSSIPNKVFVILGLSVMVQYLYQTSLIFYNSLLKDVAEEGKRGRISGLGEGMGGLGWIAGLYLFLPIASGSIAFIGEPGKHQVFLPAFILSTIFMLPMILRFKEKKKEVIHRAQNIYKKTREGIRQLWTTQKNVGLYLLAFSLISDIVLTITLYLAVVMDTVYGASEGMKSTFMGIFLIGSLIFGYLFGRIADKIGYKKLLIITCFILIITTVLFFSFSTLRILYIVASIGGIASGGYFALNKAFMTKISPTGELGEYFGLYSTFHKFASITAPLIRGGITLRLIDYPVMKYRVAGFVMCGLLIVGTILMLKVKEK